MKKAFAEATRLTEISNIEMEKKSVRDHITAIMDLINEIQRIQEQSYTSNQMNF